LRGVLTGHPNPASPRRTVDDVDNRAEVREFLVSRRAKVTPGQVGLPDDGRRRVPGLRRTEVASLAGVSIEYYSRLERGALAGVSASVLDAIARALRLDTAERTHLFHLAQAADGTSALMRPRRRPTSRWAARPGLQWILDAITAGPAIVGNSRMDLLATNHLGRALYSDVYVGSTRPPNFARFAFLDSASRRFYPDWDLAADTAVAILRTSAGQDPHDKKLHDLVGELSTRSDEFPRRRRPHPRLRNLLPHRRTWPQLDRLRPRTRKPVRGRAPTAGELGGECSPGRARRHPPRRDTTGDGARRRLEATPSGTRTSGGAVPCLVSTPLLE
jgi:transcriptional regulator with XRE-family HTH domain